MRRLILILMCIALIQNGFGQYTYFNTVDGITGDDASEGVTNCEFLDSSFYVWGGGIINGTQQKLLRTYNAVAIALDENWQEFPGNYIFSGTTNSFQLIPGEAAFLVSHALVDANGTHGFLMKVDDDLDTLWTELIDIYPGETYIYTHAWDGEGFILAGEHQVAGVGNGTFIAKVDTEGQYLWHNVLHEPEEGSYRNQTISVIPEGYIVSGSEGGGTNTEGQIEFYDTQTEVLTTLTNNEAAILRGIMSHSVRNNGDIIATQPIRTSDYPGSSNPQFTYTKSNLYLFSTDELELQLLEEFDGWGEWISGFIVKTIESSQDGLVQLGRTYLEINDSLRQISFVMKLTEDYQVDWYTELSYEICSGCVNELYDIEQAPDGGYVMVGKFNSPADPYDKTWLVKVDACGDLEWQGCAGPNGIQDWEIQSRNDGMKLEIYPNPVSGNEINIRFPQEVMVERVMLADALGRFKDLKFEIDSDGNLKSQISNLNCPAGLYSLIVTTKDGSVYSGKLVIE